MMNRKIMALLVAAELMGGSCFAATDAAELRKFNTAQREWLESAVQAGNFIHDTCGDSVVLQLISLDGSVTPEDVGKFLNASGEFQSQPTELPLIRKKAGEIDRTLKIQNETPVYCITLRGPAQRIGDDWFFMQANPSPRYSPIVDPSTTPTYALSWSFFKFQASVISGSRGAVNVLGDGTDGASCRFRVFKDLDSARAAVGQRAPVFHGGDTAYYNIVGSTSGSGGGAGGAAEPLPATDTTVDNTADVMAAQGDVSTSIADFIAGGGTTAAMVYAKIEALKNAFKALATAK